MWVPLILFVYGDSLEAQAKKLAAENAQIAKEHQELRAAGLVGYAGRLSKEDQDWLHGEEFPGWGPPNMSG